MPIYMDRHDITGEVTAEHVAQMHQADLEVQDQFGCRGLTYWYDGKRRTAFCLVEAPNEQALINMHNSAHGAIPYSIIEVDAGIVESFLGRIADPIKSGDGDLHIIDDPAFRTIMVISIEQVFSLQKVAPFYSQSKHLQESIAQLVEIYKGSQVKTSSHQMLISFQSVSHAIDAGLEIKALYQQESFKDISMNIGLSAGVPVTTKPSIFEESITLAQRMCALVPAQMIVSAEVSALCGNDTLKIFSETDSIVTLTRNEETFITQLMDYIDECWSDSELKVDDLSKPAMLSKSQLYRKLVSLTGKSPNTFLKDFRLEKALALLDKKNSNVSEIAFQCGFTSPSYFSKCFQKKYGHAPSGHMPAGTL